MGEGSARATGAGIAAVALWCASGVSLAAGGRALGVLPYVALTSAIGVATIVILHALTGRGVVRLFRPPARVAVAGFFGITIYTLLLAGALGIAQKESIGTVALLNYLWPIWIILLGMALLKIRTKARWIVPAALLGFGGVAVAQGAGSIHAEAGYLPHAMALLASFLWALYCVLLRRWEIPPEQGGSTFQFTACALLSGAMALFTGDWHRLNGLDGWTAALTIFGGVGPSGLAYYWWEIGVKRGAIHLLAFLAYFIPIVSALLIAAAYREALRPGLLPGAAMIALGAYLGSRAAQR